jgi:hypothetical protein
MDSLLLYRFWLKSGNPDLLPGDFLFPSHFNICAKKEKPRHDEHSFHRAGATGGESKVE